MNIETSKEESIIYPPTTEEKLEYLWLELTNKCDLECVHCYANSSPRPSTPDLLDHEKYKELIFDAAECGCRNIQFIGGEPSLYKRLPSLLDYATSLNYTGIAIVTNATHISSELLQSLQKNKVRVAFSIYSNRPDIHDEITGRKGSHRRTVENVKKMVSAKLEIRGSVVVMEKNYNHARDIESFVMDLGVPSVRSDDIRGFGRGAAQKKCEPDLHQLCGSCWKGILCVAPDGSVSPCSMSRSWKVGSVLTQTLSEILKSRSLSQLRQTIRTKVWEPKMEEYASIYSAVENIDEQEDEDEKKKKQPKRPPESPPKNPPKGPPVKPFCGPICAPYNHCLPD